MTTITIDHHLDLHGTGCPMNLVKVKVALAALRSGQVLETILDDGPPINNVPGSIIREGHTILDRQQLADGAWRVLIQKA